MPNTGKKSIAYSLVVEKRQCFSNWVDCVSNGPNTAGPAAVSAGGSTIEVLH